MLTLEDVSGFLAFATNVAGNIMLTRKSERGWLVRIASNLLWFAYGAQTTSLPNVLNAVVFFGINVHGWWVWRRERLRSES